MVSKGRLAGFIDAIIAVIMTIMLLEFELPKTGGILDFLKDNLVYLIAYLLSFIYVTTSWFNQQYMLSQAEKITRRIYHSCMIWVLSLSMLPVLSAWTGCTMDFFHDFGIHSPKAPALLFIVMIYIWGFAYSYMTDCFIADNPKEKAELIAQMEVYHYLRNPFWKIGMVISFIITFFYLPFVFIYTAGEMIIATIRSQNKKSST
ncbi:TMEM175 family protein [Lactococcus lactis]|uniref:TMEM175 family protein n=1 Tax=Lactococcus lactis TaxID=1358 RepID=UPI0022E2AEDA|nr:TMEM175 family protein [Lactococcus lactis]